METNSAKPIIYAVSDGRAGNVALAAGLAGRVAGRIDADVIEYNLRLSGPRAWLAARLPFLARRLPVSALPAPVLIIGAGRRAAPTVAGSGKTGAKRVQILEPQMSHARFDLLCIPSHDGPTGGNVHITLGSLGGITSAKLAEAAAQWTPEFAHLRRPLMAVLLGGDTRRKKVTPGRWAELAADLAALAPRTGLVITPSRRTGPEAEAILRAALPNAMIWDGKGENPYLGMLACADTIMATDDSVNMASEAAATGKPVALYPLLEEGGKLARFHADLVAAGHAQWFDGALPTASNGVLDETDRAARAVMDLF